MAEAEAGYRSALSADPDHPAATHFLGLLAHQRGRHDDGLRLLRRSVRLAPRSAEFRTNMAAVLGASGQPAAALAELDEAVRLDPASSSAHHNRGLALDRLGRPDDAVAALSRAVALRPDHAAARAALGRLLKRLDRADDAIPHLREAARLAPDDADAHRWLGNACRRAGRMGEAVEALRRATELEPDGPEAFSDLGGALCELGSPGAAVGPLRRAVALRPGYADARWNLGCALLTLGRFDDGWAEYEWRHRVGGRSPRPLPGTPWDGDPAALAGRTILVACEQGLGDAVQFARYVPHLARLGARVVVECHPPLRQLLAGVDGVAVVVPQGDPLPPVDLHVWLMSLPQRFGTRVDTVPVDVPYLRPDPARVDLWQPRVAVATAGAAFRVGVAWQGNPRYPADRLRSIPLAAFAPLAGVPGVRLVSLQRGAGAEQVAACRDQAPVVELSPAPDDGGGPSAAFLDAAAVMAGLDLVVTSDTAVAHLAGALGVPVWVALPFAADWRWLRGRDDSPWYPTMRLFRQATPGDWAGAFDRVADAARGEVARRAGAPATATSARTVSADATPDLGAHARVPVAPGELVDRLTILRLKADRIVDPAALRHVRAELGLLDSARRSTLPARGDRPDLDALEDELADVNAALWDVEDAIRRCDRAGDFGPRFVELARAVYATNDRRASLKRRISEALGSAIVEQKAYAAGGDDGRSLDPQPAVARA